MSDKSEVVSRNRRGQLAGLAFVLAAVVVAVVLASGAVGGSDPTKNASVVNGVKGARETAATLRGIPQRGLVLGRSDAPVTIVEFIDLKCPACQEFALTDGKDVVSSLVRTGKANLELRIMALERFRPDTLIGRTAVHSLAASNRAHYLTELLFYNQQDEVEEWITPAEVKRIANALPELRGRSLQTTPTPETSRMGAEVDALAKRLDVGGTPTIFVRPNNPARDDYREVSLKGTGSRATKIADAVRDISDR